MTDDQRQSGRTTRQMQEAPARATYVWVNERLEYPRALAKMLGRDDLRITGPTTVIRALNDSDRRRYVVVDHAAVLDGPAAMAVELFQEMRRRWL